MAQSKPNIKQGSKALEITMRDVLDGLEDSITYLGYRPRVDDMEILSIEAPGEDPHLHRASPATVHQLTSDDSSDIVSYLIARESAA